MFDTVGACRDDGWGLTLDDLESVGNSVCSCGMAMREAKSLKWLRWAPASSALLML